MMTDGGCTCEHSMTYELVQSLCCTPDTYVTLCVNYTQVENFFQLRYSQCIIKFIFEIVQFSGF